MSSETIYATLSDLGGGIAFNVADSPLNIQLIPEPPDGPGALYALQDIYTVLFRISIRNCK